MKKTIIEDNLKAYTFNTTKQTQNDLNQMCGSTPFHWSHEFNLLDAAYKTVSLIEDIQEFNDDVINDQIKQILNDNDVTLKTLTTITIANLMDETNTPKNIQLTHLNVFNTLINYLGDDESPLKDHNDKDLKKFYPTFKILFATNLLTVLNDDEKVSINFEK